MSQVISDFLLRSARAEDIDRIAEIETVSFSCPWSKRLIHQEILAGGPNCLTVAASPASDEVLAYISYFITGEKLHILNLATERRHRRQGIARALVLACLDAGRQAGAKIVRLEVRESNLAAINLYNRLGFRQVGRSPRYYIRPVEDALLFSLNLLPESITPAAESSGD